MTAALHLPFTIYHLPLIFHFPFSIKVAVTGLKCELITDNLLKIDNCPSSAVAVQPLRRMDELIIEPTVGGFRG